jgi:protein SCO1
MCDFCIINKFMLKIQSFLAIMISTLMLGACQPQSTASVAQAASTTDIVQPKQFNFEGSDVRDAGLGGKDFSLLGANGKTIHLRDFRGKVVVLVFGYTHCPDVCPTNLLSYADAINQLGEKSKQVQVLFITVDPQRDTPQVMTAYASAFNPNFIGLTVDKQHVEALNSVVDQYKIAVRKVAGSSPNEYLIDHSTGTYLLDKQGHTVVYEPHSQTATQLTHDIKQLLD